MATERTNTLRVAPGLKLDADYVAGASLALLGKRGAGKTFACRVLTEELVDAHVQTVVLDPMGVFWGLRASADGEHDGLPIPVFGGAHGDAPLEPTAGGLMADLVVDEGLSMILDLSGFGSRTQERTFAAAFLDRLYRANEDLVHLIVDEADLFAPQKPRREDAHLLVTMENIVRRGRNRGIGITMASQRAAVLNKDVLTQVDALVALRVAAPQDRDAIREWVRGQGDEATWSQLAPSLPGLTNGASWWWIPEKGILEKVQIRRTRTYDSSPTRRRGHSTRAPKTFADVDLDAISDRIAATIERAKATDPKQLTQRIRQLEAELAAAQSAAPAPLLDAALVERLEAAVATLGETQAAADQASVELLEHATQSRERAEDAAATVTAAVQALTTALAVQADAPSRSKRTSRAPAAVSFDTPASSRTASSGGSPSSASAPSTAAAPAAARPTRTARPARRRSEAPAAPAAGQPTLSDPRQRIVDELGALAGIGIDRPPRTQLAVLVGVSAKSSGFTNNLGALRSAGLIAYPSPGLVQLTAAGVEVTAPIDRPVTDEDLHARLQSIVSEPRWRLLEHLIAAYPSPLERAELADLAGVSPSSSGFTNNLGALRSLGVLDYPEPGTVAATELLFPAST